MPFQGQNFASATNVEKSFQDNLMSASVGRASSSLLLHVPDTLGPPEVWVSRPHIHSCVFIAMETSSVTFHYCYDAGTRPEFSRYGVLVAYWKPDPIL